MKKVLLFSLAIMTATLLNVCAAPIDSYQKLTSAMLKGEQLAFILDLEECGGKPGMPIGYFSPSAITLFPATESVPEHATTSHLQFINHSGSPTYEYIKFTFYLDNTVVIQTSFYEAQNFKQMGEPHIYTTSLGKGIYIKTPARAEKNYTFPPGWLLRPH